MQIETIGSATVYLGDCLEIIPMLSGIGSIISDPPYGIAAKLGMGGGNKGDGGMWKGVTIAGDESVAVRDMALQLAGVPFAVFAAPRMPVPPNSKATVVWDKGEHTGAGDLSLPWKPSFELVHISGKGWSAERRGGGVVQINAIAGCVGNRNDGHRWHPFEKPVAVMEHFVMRSPPGKILDPFMGSGTTGVACLNLGRPFVGIELDQKFFDSACERLQLAMQQHRLFA